ncbi:hypothetical protein [Paraburkholderia fynbosensis]|uniref:Uncharacterized protein n=1 Tax=Paraburkholderia fynbosensis TaxID=1200993 RepID=A0A6J5G9H0_9BURK|nr:hypothetical protein [Paraburkholderia fynbosensis]CAB3794528.1 hypothetical protein LMG27177_03649 [Paraburkholderia fynbosensis]
MHQLPVFTAEVPHEAIHFVSMGERTPVPEQQEIFQLLHNTKIGLTLSAIDNVGYEFRQEITLYPGDFRTPTISPRTAHIFAGTNSPFAGMARWMIKNHPSSKLVKKTL